MAAHIPYPIECHCGWKGDTNWNGPCPWCACSSYLPEPDVGCLDVLYIKKWREREVVFELIKLDPNYNKKGGE